MGVGSASVPGWVRAAVRFRRVRPPLGHTIRAGLCVGVPVALGFALDDVALGVVVGLACVLRTIGEREGPHRSNVSSLLIATPIAACGYLFGLVQGWPLVPLIALAAATAFVAGTLGRLGEGFALGGMQLLLVASISLGVPDTGTAEEIGWFLVGASIYAAAMALDFFLLEPRRPERIALDDLHAAVLALRGHPGPAERAAVYAAQAAARQVPPPGWRTTDRGIARWGAFAEVVYAADDLVAWEGTKARTRHDARIMGQYDDPGDWERELAEPDHQRRAQYDEARTAWIAGREGTGEPEVDPVFPSVAHRASTALDRATLERAARLALCFGIAVSSRAWLGLDHWFWVPATVGLVMQPDFGSVFGRAVLRVAGTIIGSAIAAVVLWAIPDGIGLGVAIGVVAATIPWAKQTSYVLQSVALAAAALLLVSQVAPVDGDLSLPAQRILTTAVGGAIVLVFGYLLWPAARRVSLAPTVATATAAIAELLRTASEPVPEDDEAKAVRKATAIGARQRAYDLLASTRVPLVRAAGEPPPASTDASAWSDAVRAVRSVATAVADHAIARLGGAAPLADAEEVAARIEALADDDDPLVAEDRAVALAIHVRNG